MKILIILFNTAIKTQPSRNCLLKGKVNNKNQPFLIVFGIALAVRLLFYQLTQKNMKVVANYLKS